MRVIQTLTFRMSTKTPYSDYPSIARRFLEEQKLVSHRFLYFFNELIVTRSYEQALATGCCAKAVKDCPALGKIRYLDGKPYRKTPELFLSNIDIDTGCTEADILPHMKKIHRRYGFCESDLYYSDIDFFDDVIPFERDMSRAEIEAEYAQCSIEPALLLEEQPYGSCIRLHRYSTGGNYISLSIDLLHNGIIHDATAYFNAMKALLPHIHPIVNMHIYLTKEEKENIASWDKQIAPVLQKARCFFSQRFPAAERQNAYLSNYTIASKLKTLAKQYGFTYNYLEFGVCMLDKRTPRGHVLQLLVVTGPSHYDTRYYINIQGVGFRHELCNSMQTPDNQAESDACSEKMLLVISEFEKTLIPELDTYYEETPNWFVPSPW